MVDVFYPMQWIADKVTYDLLGIEATTGLAKSLNFIIYDVLKIFVLLWVREECLFAVAANGLKVGP